VLSDYSNYLKGIASFGPTRRCLGPIAAYATRCGANPFKNADEMAPTFDLPHANGAITDSEA